jgi:hypothetical protein
MADGIVIKLIRELDRVKARGVKYHNLVVSAELTDNLRGGI